MTTPSQYISAAASLCSQKSECRRWDSNIDDGEYAPQIIHGQHSDVFYHLVTNLDCKHACNITEKTLTSYDIGHLVGSWNSEKKWERCQLKSLTNAVIGEFEEKGLHAFS